MRLPLSIPAALLLTAATGAAQVQDLGTVPVSGPGSTPTTTSYVTGISDDGGIVVGVGVTTTNRMVPSAWSEASGYLALDEPPAPFHTLYLENGPFVSGDGSTAVGSYAPDGTTPGGLTGGTAIWDIATGAVQPVLALSRVNAVSDDGLTCAGACIGTRTHACRWTAAGGVETIGLPATGESTATDISGDGSVIVGTYQPSNGLTVPFRWTEATGLVPLAGFVGENASVPQVSRDGQVITGLSTVPGTPRVAFRWTAAGGFTSLGTLGGGVAADSVYINDDGSVIAGTEFGASILDRIGWRWTEATGITRLSPLPSLSPTGISADGSVLPCVESSFPTYFPSRWTTSGGAERLALLEASVEKGVVNATSADGSIFAGTCGLTPTVFHATLWRSDGTLGRTVCSPGVPNSTGAPASLRLTGSNRRANGALVIEASSLPPGAFGFVIGSRAEGFAAAPGGSQGNLCLSGAIGRYVGPGQIQTASPAGEFTLTIDPSALAQPTGTVGSTYGESWFFQVWHRDVNPASTSNFTNAATVRLF